MRQRITNSGMHTFLVTIILGLFVVSIVLILIAMFQNDSNYKYVAFIKNQLLFSCAPMIVIGLLFLFLGLIFFKKRDCEVIEKWMITIWCTFSMILVFYIIGTISVHYMDIKNEDYVIYNGEFQKDHTRDFVFLNDENSTRLINTNETFLETGNYSGTIVYSKRSKYVLEYSLNNGKKASVVDNR